MTNTVNTKFDCCYFLASLPGDIVAMTSEVNNCFILTLYNMKKATEIHYEAMTTSPTGLAYVAFGGRPALAISYG